MCICRRLQMAGINYDFSSQVGFTGRAAEKMESMNQHIYRRHFVCASGRVTQGGRAGNPLCVRGGGQHRRAVPRRAVLVYRTGRERVESLTKSANRRVAGTMCLSGGWGCPNQQSAGFASGQNRLIFAVPYKDCPACYDCIKHCAP